MLVIALHLEDYLALYRQSMTESIITVDNLGIGDSSKKSCRRPSAFFSAEKSALQACNANAPPIGLRPTKQDIMKIS